MANLTFSFLGSTQVALAQKPVTHFRSAKTQGLLLYLVMEAQRAHTREALFALLWPEEAQAVAQNNLRQALFRLRQLLEDETKSGGQPYLLIDRQTVQFNPASDYRLDVAEFKRDLAQEELEQAVAHYQGELLAGFSCESTPFDEWLFFARESLQLQALAALTTLSQVALTGGKPSDAIRYARRQLALEPWREEAHQQLMAALAAAGERSKALAHFETCRTALWEELQVEPSTATVALVERIRSGEWRMARPEGTREGRDLGTLAVPSSAEALREEPILPSSEPLVNPKSKIQNRIDWGEMPQPDLFYGRDQAVEELKRWLLHEGCRLVAVLGMGGQGKTTLAAKLTRNLGEMAATANAGFEVVIWRSLLNAPDADLLVTGWLTYLTERALPDLPATWDERLILLLAVLRQQRCLLVLDNAESILEPGLAEGRAGHYRPGYAAYGQLFQRIGESPHRSCLLITSREKPLEVARLERTSPFTRTLQLEGLDAGAGQALLRAAGITPTQAASAPLIQRYSGNPLALLLIADVIQDLYDGDVTAFLQGDTLIFDDVRDVLDQQFARLSVLERNILLWLAIERVPVTLEQLRGNLLGDGLARTLPEAVRSLQRRSLVEKAGEAEGGAGLRLQNVITEYLTEHLIHQVCRELTTVTPRLLHSHALLRARAQEYVRESQQRVILQPIAERLLANLGLTRLQEQVLHLLDSLRAASPRLPSYLAGNLLNLLLHLDIDLRGFNFAHLSVWQANLRGAILPAVDFSGADLAHCTFTDTFSSVLAVAFSPDGRLLAAGTENGEIRFWQTADGQPYALIKEVTANVSALSFSPDGALLACAGGDDKVRLWTVGAPSASGQLVRTLHGHNNAVKALAFHPAGQLLASGGADHTIVLWDVGRGAPVGDPLRGHSDWVMALAFSPDGKTLASASDDQRIILWDVASGQPRHTLLGHSDWVLTLAFSPDGATLVSAGRDKTVRLWDVAPGKLRTILHGHSDWVLTVAFSPEGDVIASAGQDHQVRLWDAASGQPLQTLHRHTNWVRALAFSPARTGARLLASGSTDQTVRLWSVPTGEAIQTLQGYTNWIRAVAFSPDGQTIAGGGIDQAIHLQDAATGQPLRRLRGHTRGVTAVAYSPNGRLLASSSADRTVRLWSAVSGTLLQTLIGHTDVVFAVAFSPDGELIASTGDDQTVRLWETRTGALRITLHGHTQGINGLAFSPSGAQVASASDDGTVHLWGVDNGQIQAVWRGHTQWVRAVAFSPAGDLAASAGEDKTVRIWDCATGTLRHTLTNHSQRVTGVAFSPDGQLLASASGDQTIRLWEPQSGQELAVLRGHHNVIWSIAFHPTGNLLVSSSVDETIKVWEVGATAALGACRQTFQVVGPYSRMKIAGITGVTDAQKVALKVLGAVE